jgi:N-acetylneuraminic acid mutarotase
MPDARNGNSVVWTGSEMIIWGGWGDQAALNSGAKYNPQTDTWTPLSVQNSPSARYGSATVWTGAVMIIWSGYYFGPGGSLFPSDGYKYDPQNDEWIQISSNNQPAPRMGASTVWTGAEMIVWGGQTADYSISNSGGKYNPVTNKWTATSTGPNVPEQRVAQVAVWTGTEMLIWGGTGYNGPTNSGGKYKPDTDSWSVISTLNAPIGRECASAVWSGQSMIVWGGYGVVNNSWTYLNSGGIYNPVTNLWVPTSTTVNCPSARCDHSAVWCGNEMIVWGGYNGVILGDGFKYNPSNDSWVPISNLNAPSPRAMHSAIWTGEEMIIWGGNLNTGGRYNPDKDSWIPTYSNNVPSSRTHFSSIWTGYEMIVWGGYNTDTLSDGGKYIPSTDSWSLTSKLNAPSKREDHSVVWTGSEMIVWGGVYYSSYPNGTNTGGKYNPVSDTWVATSTEGAVPEARYGHTAVWTGSEMIIWGGGFQTGGRYYPNVDLWLPTSLDDQTPQGRNYSSAVWTGSEMIVWGGQTGNREETNTGGKYDPRTNQWSLTSTENAPPARAFHSAVWANNIMIIWGGEAHALYFNDCWKYDLSSDTWDALSSENAPTLRNGYSSIWTGSEMIIWGGYEYTSNGNQFTNTGGRYSIANNKWTPTSVLNAPIARRWHTAVWTGSAMIVWGGLSDAYIQQGGIYFPYALSTPPEIFETSTNPCPSPSVSLSVPGDYVSYQWNLNGIPIDGATSSTYEATVSGNYTVFVTDSEGCSGTSEPHPVTIVACIPEIIYDSKGSFTEVTGDVIHILKRARSGRLVLLLEIVATLLLQMLWQI